MSGAEHKQLVNIQPDMLPPRFYFRAFNGKRNFAPPADQSEWFKLENLVLQNGDEIGVATSWAYPADCAKTYRWTWSTASWPISIAGCRTGAGTPTITAQRSGKHGRSCRSTARARPRANAAGAVAKWIEEGTLHEDEYRDEARREAQNGLFVRKTAAA